MISQANHKKNAKRLRSWSVTLKIRRYVPKRYARRNRPSGATVTQQSTGVSSAKGSLWRPTSQIVWTLSSRSQQHKATLPESSVGMASSAWIAKWSGRCKSSWATLKCNNGIAKRCKWVTRPKNRCRYITEDDCKNRIITITISLLWIAPRTERPSRNCVSLTPFNVTTCDFITIICDIRLKNFVAISTVKDAKFEVCEYTWATEWQKECERYNHRTRHNSKDSRDAQTAPIGRRRSSSHTLAFSCIQR